MERASDTREMTWEGRGRGSVGQRLKKVTNFQPQKAGVDLSHAHLASIQPWHAKHPGLEEARAGSGQDEGQQVKGPKVTDQRHQQWSPLSLREEDAAPHTTTDHFAGLHSLEKLPCVRSVPPLPRAVGTHAASPEGTANMEQSRGGSASPFCRASSFWGDTNRALRSRAGTEGTPGGGGGAGRGVKDGRPGCWAEPSRGGPSGSGLPPLARARGHTLRWAVLFCQPEKHQHETICVFRFTST